MPIDLVSSRSRRAPQELIARSQKSCAPRREGSGRSRARRIEVRGEFDAAAFPIERSYRVPRRRGRPVLSEISWPSSRGHSSRRTSPTSLYLLRCADENEQEEEEEEEQKNESRSARKARRWTRGGSRFFKCHEPGPFSLVSADALETRRLLLDT